MRPSAGERTRGIEATTTVRERHAAYAAAHEIALRHRDEMVPLRGAITDEMLLTVNGMLAGTRRTDAEVPRNGTRGALHDPRAARPPG